MKKIYIAIITLLLASCASITPEKLAQRTDDDVCKTYGGLSNLAFNGKKMAAPWKDELIRRKLVTDDELTAIENKKIFVGMKECALYASWGEPRKQNRTVSGSGVRVQNIYGSYGKHNKPTYVYVSNGVVTSWQD